MMYVSRIIDVAADTDERLMICVCVAKETTLNVSDVPWHDLLNALFISERTFVIERCFQRLSYTSD